MSVDFALAAVRVESPEPANATSAVKVKRRKGSLDAYLRRGLWALAGYAAAKTDLSWATRAVFDDLGTTQHKGLLLLVVAFLVTLYVVCALLPLNAVAEWDAARGASRASRRWRPGASVVRVGSTTVAA